MSPQEREDLAARLREYRKAKGWSQERMGQEARISTNTVFRIEHALNTMQTSIEKMERVLSDD